MKLGIMQPYFFPYLGYFDLINSTDRWIVFDPVQYIRHGWINRNRILHPNEGWQYVVVPLKKHSRGTLITDIEVNDAIPWRQKIKGQLQHYRKRAPFYRQTMDLVDECLGIEHSSISRLNTEILQRVCKHLEISFDHAFFADLDLPLPDIDEPGDWALEISAALGASEYVNPPGGEAIFERRKFDERGIRLTIRGCPALEYPTHGYKFEPNLSVLDVLMWNPASAVKEYLDQQLAQ